VLPDARLPFFIVAHSTGALVALSQAPYLENRIERMVLAAPFMALAGQSMSQRKITIIARLASLLGFWQAYLPQGRSADWTSLHNIVTSDQSVDLHPQRRHLHRTSGAFHQLARAPAG
jgi:lysophospholipase